MPFLLFLFLRGNQLFFFNIYLYSHQITQSAGKYGY